MRTVVISLGGSLIFPGKIAVEFLKAFKSVITPFAEKQRVVIVCGGGTLAREYITAASQIIKCDDTTKDWLGIGATRQNALLLQSIFGEAAYEQIIQDPTQPFTTEKQIIIAAGWKPGFSTDMGAVKLAELLHADEVINMSNITHVYDKDPRQHPEAQKQEQLTWEAFQSIVGNTWKPGMNAPFDPIASTVAAELNLKVIILGNDTENLSACLNRQPFIGTTISNS